MPQADEWSELRMAADAYRAVMLTVGARPAETGGVLLGPIDSNDVTEFYFDHTASTTRTQYSPDVATFKELMRECWLPAELDMKGFVHSHPPGVDRLSHGDRVYIERLLTINPDMEIFAAPIVLPNEYRLCPFIVHRAQPSTPIHVRLTLFS